jgi:hypothetical protein
MGTGRRAVPGLRFATPLPNNNTSARLPYHSIYGLSAEGGPQVGVHDYSLFSCRFHQFGLLLRRVPYDHSLRLLVRSDIRHGIGGEVGIIP